MRMNRVVMHMSIEPISETAPTGVFELAFGLGWAVADPAHLPVLPEALARLLRVPAARVAVVHWNGTKLLEYAYNANANAEHARLAMLHEVERNLSDDYLLRLSIESPGDLGRAEAEMLDRAARVLATAIDCILIRPQNPTAMGEPFAGLSEREWKICLALERPEGEKQIAGALDCSRHTVIATSRASIANSTSAAACKFWSK